MKEEVKLPWIKVELSVTDIKTDEYTERTLYLYESDWEDMQNYIDSKKTHLTVEEMSKMFDFISKNFESYKGNQYVSDVKDIILKEE